MQIETDPDPERGSFEDTWKNIAAFYSYRKDCCSMRRHYELIKFRFDDTYYLHYYECTIALSRENIRQYQQSASTLIAVISLDPSDTIGKASNSRETVFAR